MVELRPYQRDLLQQVQTALAADTKARVMMQLPTGGGKTVIAGALLADWLTDGRKAVWLTHRAELAEQTCRMLTDAHISAMTNVKWTPGTDAPAMSGGAVILMAQTVSRRTDSMEIWNGYNADDLMAIDEAHHAAAEGWERAMKQWPGRIVGMTATPWRLSKKEGFDHLFDELLCGPQVTELQAADWLCDARTLLPPPEQRIIGGEVDRTGDYTELGIERANRPDVMTAGVVKFWQKDFDDRPTIAYAVSVEHARNLADVFNDADIPAAVILGDTSSEERNKAIAGFREETLKVLVNVVVATEGFDLPDASCIVIARPTMSLALYLQMVGRGLRPKDGGDCLILDLAANSEKHGLPEAQRKWSLEPRGIESPGEASVVWCPKCETVSPAASHHCQGCGDAFGKDCNRCGKWRAWKRWEFENHCGDAHELVCDLCHIDAHIQAHLPVTKPLDELIEEDEMLSQDYPELNGELANRLAGLFKELLEQERRSVTGASDDRQHELLAKIERREAELNDDDELDALFERHIAALPETEQPKTRVQERRMFGDWEDSLKSELTGWKDELDELENRPIDKQLIFNSVQNKAMSLLQREARAADLLPEPLELPDDDEQGKGERKKGRRRKGFELVKDYLIPIVRHMKVEGKTHTEAFRLVSDSLGAKSTSTARERCTRGLGLSLKQFVDAVQSGEIIQIIKQKRPQQVELTKRALEPLYLRKEGQELATSVDRGEDEQVRDIRRNSDRLRKGQKTPVAEFFEPILLVLKEMGGSGEAVELVERVGQAMKPMLRDVDYELLKGDGKPRWEKTFHWARWEMVKDGLLKPDSPRGVWEISEKGRTLLSSLAVNKSRH